MCDDDAPELKTQDYVDRANKVYKSLDTERAQTDMAQTTGCTGSSAFDPLPHHDRYLNTPVEPMHLIKCISEHVVKLISGVEDSIKVRNEETHRMRFTSSWPTEVQSGSKIKIVLPSAPFCLSKSDS